MSILCCTSCGAYIDTDEDVEAFQRDEYDAAGKWVRSIWLCGACREDLEEDENETQ